MPGLLSAVFTLFFTALLMGIQIAVAQTSSPETQLCPKLADFNQTVKLSPIEFDEQLDHCAGETKDKRNNLTREVEVLVNLYEYLKNNSLLELSSLLKPDHMETLDLIRKCVKDNIGKELNAEEARKHFGFNDTQFLIFEQSNCKQTMNTRDCIDDVYSGIEKDAETILHKAAFMASFEMLSLYCEGPLRHIDTDASYNVIPSFSMVLGTALMLTKLAIFN